MHYSEFVEVYDELYGTTKRLEKISILAKFLKKLERKGESEWVYLLRGRALPYYDTREFGISNKLAIKAIGKGLGVKESEIYKRYRKVGDLGEIAEEFAGKGKQSRLFSSKLSVKKVFDNLRKLPDMEGKGSVDKKIVLISELLGHATGKEAKYIIRTLLGDLRVGVADGILRDSLAEAFFEKDKKEMAERIEDMYDLSNDFAEVFDAAKKGKKAIEGVKIALGRPTKVMLAVKVENIDEAFRMCGKPAAIEHKYDGFRLVISKEGDKVGLFTRRLENVTKQFPDIVEAVKKYVKGKSFILDSEIVGYDPETKKYKPFQSISQRIKRKYDIDKLVKELPVEAKVFDVLYYNNKSLMQVPFRKRRDILERIIKKKKMKIMPTKQLVTDSEKKVKKFYEEALKMGEEGVMFKKLDAPYKQGRRVGYMVKMKPVVNDLDLVIIGAEYGSGKRAGWLTSYIVACKSEDKFLEIGKVSSGLKEKEDGKKEDVTYGEMSRLLRPLITKEKGKEVRVKPKIVVTVTYQNIQKSPNYTSGYALRFPRITTYRPDRKKDDVATMDEVKREYGKTHG